MHELREAVDFFHERVFLAKALNPNNPKHFVRILNNLGKAVKGITGPAEADALRAALRTLDVDWVKMTDQQRDRVVDAAKAAIAKPAAFVAPKVVDTLTVVGLDVASTTRKTTKQKYGMSITVDLPTKDVTTIEAIANDQSNYIRDEYGKRSDNFATIARDSVALGIAAGEDTGTISQRLQTNLAEANRSEAYWDMIASGFANRSRVYSNLSSYQDSGISWFHFDAVMDERTSEICEFMHGKRFQVAKALDGYARADSKGAPAAQPWLNMGVNDDGDRILYFNHADGGRRQVATIEQPPVGKMLKGSYGNALSNQQLQAAGISAPPLHGNCRSTIVPDL